MSFKVLCITIPHLEPCVQPPVETRLQSLIGARCGAELYGGGNTLFHLKLPSLLLTGGTQQPSSPAALPLGPWDADERRKVDTTWVENGIHSSPENRLITIT